MINLCDKCKCLDVCPCPILDRAISQGLEGMEVCEMQEVMNKVYAAGKQAGRLGASKVAA